MENQSEQIKKKLGSRRNSEKYATNEIFQNHLLEQYKLYQESAENISSRRHTANSFFVTINTTLIALISYIHLGDTNAANYYCLISLCGIAISYMWYRLIRSYRDLNAAKYKVIQEIEKCLPISPYEAEWGAVGEGKNSKLYLPFTHIESYIPRIFLILHLVVLFQSAYFILFPSAS